MCVDMIACVFVCVKAGANITNRQQVYSQESL